MSSLYARFNRNSYRWLWWVVIVGLIVSSPLAYMRWKTETSSKNVELVFDYRDLMEVSGYKADPEAFIQEQLKRMKTAGSPRWPCTKARWTSSSRAAAFSCLLRRNTRC